jgi:D-alanyl-D-alanine carboxypeptidase/D-alanyl-D-alanine-endopeptidase (penicillin-binding protein 4)
MPFRSLSFYVLAFCAGLFFAGCAVNRKMEKKVNTFFKNSPVLNNHHVGFALSDLADGQKIVEKEADKFFIPASNTKLFTFYAGLKMLPDSVPALRYIEKGDSLIFWGTGDPSFLQSQLKGVKALTFLKDSPRKLFFAPGRYTGNFYGLGWSWDDYNDYYQAEISELPLMDNLVAVSNQRGTLQVQPHEFNDCFVKDSTKKTFNVIRDFNGNRFSYPDVPVPEGYNQLIPYKTSTLLTLNLLTDTLHRQVQLISMPMPANAKTIYNVPSLQVLREMMLPSDNFIAEQLLLVYANQFQSRLNGSDAIKYISEKYLTTMPDHFQWVDGSGLSRMNLFSPRDIIVLLQLIDKEVNNREKLFSLLPAGGKTGTLKNAYPKTDHPFVFGKTGSLSSNYNQSGYLVTKKGKTLCFSFMNNNFVNPLTDVRQEMAKLITYIHDTF